MTVKVFTIAALPEELVQTWLQHLRDFDQAHPGCHFEVAADAPHMSLPEMVAAVRIEPELSFSEIIERRRRDDPR
jgi:hypothetical protein